jgi:argininosuccinate lyase
VSVYRAANIRLAEGVRPELAEVCLPGPDERVLGRYARMGPQLEAFHAFDKAHLVMLCEQGLLPTADARAMLRVLRELEAGDAIAARAATAEHMHSGEAILTTALGPEVAGRLHLGRSSGDLLTVSFRFTLRARLLRLIEGLDALRHTVLMLAREHTETVMPGSTHLQHAQPDTFAHYLLAHASAFERDGQRLRQYYARLNLSPAGAAILNGSEFALDRERMATLLGFDGLALNTRDAVWGRDLETEAHTVTLLLAGNFNRLAEDLMLWSAPEFGLVECADGFCGTSSIMPQKKNPNALECLKGVVATVTGHLVSTAMVHKNPSTVPVFEWVRSMSDAWRGYDEMNSALPLMEAILRTLTVHRERMAHSAGRHWATATDLAAALVREAGLTWRAAHQVTGIVVRLAIEQGLAPAELDSELLDRAAQQQLGRPLGLDTARLRAALDPGASVRRHRLPGGPAPERVGEAIALHEVELTRDERWATQARQRVDAAAAHLEAAIDGVLAA